MRCSTLLCLSVSLLALSLPAAAQAEAETGTVTEEFILVEGRAPVAAARVTSSISVFTAEDLETLQIRGMFDLFRLVPGAQPSRSGPPGTQSQLRIRGAEANHVLVLIDGVEINDPARDSGVDFAFLLATGAIARIEVLRGPQSALWGADALAGVINIVTRTAGAGFAARGRIEGGSFGTVLGDAVVQWGGERAGLTLGANYARADGSNISRAGNEADGYETLTLSARGGIDLGTGVRLDGAARFVDAENAFDSGFPLPADSPDRSEVQEVSGRLDLRIDTGGPLSLRLGASHFASVFDTFGGFPTFLDASKTKLDAEAIARFDAAGAAHTLALLAEVEEERFEQRAPTFPLADQDQEIQNAALAGEWRAEFSGGLSLVGALRHDWNDRFEDAFTWRIGASYLVAATDTRLRASLARAVKNPTFSELYGFAPAFFIGNPDLEPERSTGWEIGVAQPLFDGRLALDLVYFEADLENEIFTDFLVFPATARNRTTESRRRGVELAADLAIAEGLALSGHWTYLRSEENGTKEIRRPEHSGSLALTYVFDEGRGDLFARAEHTGKRTDTDFALFVPVELGAYTLISIGGGYEIRPGVRLFGRVENLTDLAYEDVIGFRGQGIGAFAGLSVVWGE